MYVLDLISDVNLCSDNRMKNGIMNNLFNKWINKLKFN